MVIRVSDLSSLYKFPMGRTEFALREVERRARSRNKLGIANLALRGANEAQAAMRQMVRYQAGQRSQYPPQATILDNLVDHCVSAFFGYLEVQIRAYPTEPRGLAAKNLISALFPDGVRAITGLPYAEEHAAVNTLLAMAADPELATDLNLLPESSELLERLRMRNQEYGVVLNQSDSSPTHQQVLESQDVALDTLTATLGLIIGTYAQEQPINTEERNHLLEPILKQNDALRTIYRRRRVITDVDPQTGEELPPAQPVETTPAPGDADAPA